MTWNEPGADPVRDVRTMRKAIEESTGFRPATMLINRSVYADIQAFMVFPGPWPWDWLRRRIMRWALGRFYVYQDEVDPPETEEGEDDD